MHDKMPKTPFATRFSGGAKEAELRIRSIFQWKKQRPPVWLFVLVLLATLGCAGLVSCQEQAKLPENEDRADEVLVLHTSEGHEITVELDLEPTVRDANYNMVTQLRVVENEQIVQIIDPAELTATYSIEGLYLLRGYDTGEPDVRDFNFDGNADLALLAESMIPQNPAYLFFVWNEEGRQLKDSFVMSGMPELDKEQQQIVEKMASGRCRYYDWQEGWLRENPAPRQTMELLEQIGEPFEQFSDMEFQNVDIPDSSGQCMEAPKGGIRYYFFGTQALPGLSELPDEYRQRLRCAGIISTVGDMYPETTESMSLDAFCTMLGTEEYDYGYEDAPDQGWLKILGDRFTTWIDTDNPVHEVYDPSNIYIDSDDVILFVDDAIEKENYLICEEYWNEIMMAELEEYWHSIMMAE